MYLFPKINPSINARIILAAGCITLLVSLLIVYGWVYSIESLTAFFPGTVTMKFNTALCFAFSAIGLLTFQLGEKRNTQKKIHNLAILLLILLSGLSLLQYFIDMPLFIDELLIKDYNARLTGYPYPGRMATTSALNFLMYGVALRWLNSERKRRSLIGQWMLHFISTVALMACLGYLYSVPSFYRFDTLTSMAIPTAGLFLMLSLASTLLRPTLGLTSVFSGEQVGSVMAKKIFPILTALLIAIGFVEVTIFQSHPVSNQFSIAILVTAFILLGVSVIYFVSNQLNKIDLKRTEAEKQISDLNVHLEEQIKLRTTELLSATSSLQLVTQGINLGIWDTDLSSGKMNWEGAMFNLYGITPKDFDGTYDYWLSTLHPDDVERCKSALNEAMANDSEFSSEYRIIWPDQSVHWIKALAYSQKNNGQPSRLLGINYDITLQKKTELLLEESNHRNKIFVEQSPSSIAMFDKEMYFVAASGQWLADYNLSSASILNRKLFEVFPSMLNEWRPIIQQCQNGEVYQKDEVLFHNGDGSTRWISLEFRPWFQSGDEIGGLLMFTADISHRKFIEEQLRISEEAFRGAFESAVIGMALIDTEGQWLKVNQSLCKIVGYSARELTSLTIQDITHPDDQAINLALFQDVKSGIKESYQLEKRYQHKDGNYIWVVLAASMVKDVNGNPIYFVAQITDISHKKAAEEKLQNTLIHLNSILQGSSQVSIIGTNLTGSITSFNKGAENLLGYRAEEVVGLHTPELIHVPEEIEAHSKELSAVFNKEISGFNSLVEYAKNGEFESKEWTYVRKDKTTFPVQLIVTALKNSGNEIIGFLGVASDISQLKAVETEIKSLLDVAKAQNQRLLNFAHIVSHNLRSHTANLTMILNLMQDENNEIVQNEMFQLLRDATVNLGDSVTNLNEVTAITAKTVHDLTPVNLHLALNKALINVQALLHSCDGVCQNQVDSTVKIMVVPAYLDSVLLNFLSNAIKYRSPDRKLEINLSVTRENNFTVLSIKDNGLGIDLKHHRDKIFGMYKTFHGNEDARGIGLFLSKNQIEAMGGRVDVESEVNVGSIFKIYFHEKN